MNQRSHHKSQTTGWFQPPMKTEKRYPSRRFRPSTESRTRNRLRGFSGRGSCRGFRNRPHRLHRRRGGYRTAWGKQRGRASFRLPAFLLFHLSNLSSDTDLQDVHDDPCGPAVHGPAVPLPAHHLRSCKERNNLVHSAAAGCSSAEKPSGCSLTQVLGRPTGVLDEPVLQFSQMEVADDYFGVLQAVVINQVLQLKEHMGVVTLSAFLLPGFHFQS